MLGIKKRYFLWNCHISFQKLLKRWYWHDWGLTFQFWQKSYDVNDLMDTHIIYSCAEVLVIMCHRLLSDVYHPLHPNIENRSKVYLARNKSPNPFDWYINHPLTMRVVSMFDQSLCLTFQFEKTTLNPLLIEG